MEKKDKKKTLTISSNLKKKIDTSSISTGGKKSFSVKKKEPFRGNKNSNRSNQTLNQVKKPDLKKVLRDIINQYENFFKNINEYKYSIYKNESNKLKLN